MYLLQHPAGDPNWELGPAGSQSSARTDVLLLVSNYDKAGLNTLQIPTLEWGSLVCSQQGIQMVLLPVSNHNKAEWGNREADLEINSKSVRMT